MIDFIQKNKILLDVMKDKLQEEHFHPDVELIYVLDGQLVLRIYEKEFLMKTEDIIVVNANEPHSFQASGDILFARIYISYDLLRQVYSDVNCRFVCNSVMRNAQNYIELRRVLKNLLMNYLYIEQNENQEKLVNYEYLSIYFHLVELLTVHFLMNMPGEAMTKSQKNARRMLEIHDYIEGNYAQPISFTDLAKHLYLSEGYLSRYFKQNFNMKFTDYLRKVRLAHAMDALMYSAQPVTKIAYDHGFSSVSFFNKVFKEVYGETPTSVREKSRTEAEKKVEAKRNRKLSKQLENFLNKDRSKAAGNVRVEKTSHCFSGIGGSKMDPSWNKVINIGSASDILKSEVQEHIIMLSHALNYKYIRFWSIFSKEMLIDIHSEQDDYNFAKLDQVLDFLVERGLKPFIDLEEKIRRINATTDEVILYEENAVEFNNIEQWRQLMESMMRHLVKRYGVEEMCQWKIEVWFGGYSIACEDAVDGYFHILRSVYGIVKKYVPDLEIGGCGVFPESIKDPKLRKMNFWKEWKKQAPRPDFISLMNYAYDPDISGRDHFGKRSTDAQYLLHTVRNVRRELTEAGFEDIQIYITEWNLTVSDRNYLNDSCFQGAYIVKNIIDVWREVDMLGYYTGSDRRSEYYDSASLLHGGSGLLSKDGIFKPAAFAMDFLNHMYSYYVESSGHFLMTTDQRSNYAMVCHNLRPLSYYYYLTSEDRIGKDKVWCCFEDQDRLDLEFCMEDMEQGEYQIKIHRVNTKSGSILDAWGALDYYKELSREDVKYFRRICEPRLEIKKYTVDKNRVEFKLSLEANEIAFVEIRKEF